MTKRSCLERATARRPLGSGVLVKSRLDRYVDSFRDGIYPPGATAVPKVWPIRRHGVASVYSVREGRARPRHASAAAGLVRVPPCRAGPHLAPAAPPPSPPSPPPLRHCHRNR